MDENNYVGAEGTGFVSVVGGVKLWFPTQQAAEQNFNQRTGQPNGAGNPAGSYATPNGQRTIAQIRAELAAAGYNGPQDDASLVAAYNRTAAGPGAGASSGAGAGGYDWNAYWNAQQQSNREQFDWTKQNAARQQYGEIARALLSGAASLTGPQDWLKYAQYTQGGKNIFSTLFGSQGAPAFGAPSGNSQALTIGDILSQLGLTSPGSGTTGGAAATGGATAQSAQAPLPHQVNPAVWDSLSPTARAMVLGSVQAGNTPSGYWNPDDWLAQINATRPRGTAPRVSTYNFGNPASAF